VGSIRDLDSIDISTSQSGLDVQALQCDQFPRRLSSMPRALVDDTSNREHAYALWERHIFAEQIHRGAPRPVDPSLPANHSLKIRGKIVAVSYLAIVAAHLDADALKEFSASSRLIALRSLRGVAYSTRTWRPAPLTLQKM